MFASERLRLIDGIDVIVRQPLLNNGRAADKQTYAGRPKLPAIVLYPISSTQLNSNIVIVIYSKC